MAHAYAHLFALPCTGLRFFTVYGPWGRPDMAPMLFAEAILARAGRSGSSTKAGTAATSPSSTTSPRGWSAPPTRRDRPTRPGTRPPPTRHLGRAVPHLQHRQRRPGRAPRLHRRARARARAQGDPRAAADAARRRARHLGRLRPARGGDRLAARRPRSRRASRASSPGTATSTAGDPPARARFRRRRRPACVRAGLRRRSRGAMGRSAGSIEGEPFGAVVPAPDGYPPAYVRAVIAEAAEAGLRAAGAPAPAADPGRRCSSRSCATRRCGSGFLAHYRRLGVTRFAIIDHGSGDATRGAARRRGGRRALRRRPAVPGQAGAQSFRAVLAGQEGPGDPGQYLRRHQPLRLGGGGHRSGTRKASRARAPGRAARRHQREEGKKILAKSGRPYPRQHAGRGGRSASSPPGRTIRPTSCWR